MEQNSQLVNEAGKTVLLTAFLAVTGSFIAFLTEWMIVIPLLFSLGIPLINIQQNVLHKIRIIMLIVVGTVVIFTGAVLLMLNIDYSQQVLQAAVVGTAGCLILLLNGILIPSLQLSWKAFVYTFILAAVSVPVGVWLTEKFPGSGDSLFSDFFGQYGIMILWMIMTCTGIISGTMRKNL